MNLASLESAAGKLVAEFAAAEPAIAAAVTAAAPTVEAALGAAVSAYNPALAGAAKFAFGLAKIAAGYVSSLESIKASSPNVDPATWDAIADGNIADDAAIMALEMPAS